MFDTAVSSRITMEIDNLPPKLATFSWCNGQQFITGGPPEFPGDFRPHSAIAFHDDASASPRAVLDLASMQFGDVGRGLNGKSTFVLEKLEDWYARLQRITGSNTLPSVRAQPTRIGNVPRDIDVWLLGCARRAKARWENREQEPWCGHCGKPATATRCSRCKKAYYCDADHQRAAWPLHKYVCAPQDGA